VRVKDLLKDEFDDVKFIETLKNCIWQKVTTQSVYLLL
jgi:hypothetical protein